MIQKQGLEIVVPVFHNGQLTAVLDIDSPNLSDFDETDGDFLKKQYL